MSSSSSTSVERYGLTEVFTCENPAADVVFVHGLNGDPERTWTSKATGKYWPRDFLPNDLDGRARILVYGYDADVVAWGNHGGVGKDRIHNHSERLVATLVANRRRHHAEERPLIFVAHSLGGLVVKRALIYSSEIRVGTRTERLRSVFLSTYGILFLGTPHHGSDIAVWGSYLERLAGTVIPKRLLDSSNQLVDALKSNSETLINIDRQFSAIMSLFHIYLFHESKKTDVKGTLTFIVEEDSAAPTLPEVERSSIPADHSSMCKFDSERSPGYDIVLDAISFYVEDATESHAIAGRWRQEKQVRRIGQGNLLHEGYGSPQPEVSEPSSRGSSPAPTAGNSVHALPSGETSYIRLPQLLDSRANEPFLFVPPGFRPNSYFVGMAKQLTELDERLFDHQLRQQGTAAVLLHGPAGSGKSHLARQYVYKHRTKFKGGIFWINARYYHEMCKDLWQIAQKYVARDSPGIRIEPSGNGKEYISAVREWFSSRNEWLIVLDGVAVDNRAQAERLQKLIPDSRNSSLIYTSRSSQLYASQRLLHPHPIRVPRLSDKEGQDLIFKEINVKRTASNEKAALALVEKVGGLPLAIHALSVRLAETHEPLEKYSPKSYADDPRLGVPFHEIIQDLFTEHIEAYNLMNILAFFGPHIPVELLILGLRALQNDRIEVRTRASIYEAADINTSFSVLMRNALVERNEPNDTESAASSRSSLLEPEPIDVLRLHTVVQKFCRDRLKGNKSVGYWIHLASKVLLCSYHEAHLKMDERGSEHPPRVSDFREYLVHAQIMRDHIIEHEHRYADIRELRPKVEGLLSEIKSEIADREPSSSQESVIRHYAVSIFDRTSSTSSTNEPPVTPGYKQLPRPQPDSFWGTDIINSPVEYRAIDMLRHLSSNTVRSGQVIVDDIEMPKEPQHIRTGSKPEFSQGNFILPPSTSVHAQLHGDHARGNMASFAMNRDGNLSGSSKAVSGLTEIYRNSPPPARGGAFITSRRSSPSPARETGSPLPPYAQRLSRPGVARTATLSRPAAPKLTRYIPNPNAPEFVPSSWPRYPGIDYLVSNPQMSDTMNSWDGQETGVINAQGIEPAVAPGFNPAYWQMQTSMPNTSIDQNLHASWVQSTPPGLSYYQNQHGRAASVPEIPSHLVFGPLVARLGTHDPANITGLPQNYAPLTMSRENSSQSRSSGSGSGVTALRPPSVPQYISPFLPPTHPLAQVSAATPSTASQSTFVPQSSPLQNVQTLITPHSVGSISPVSLGHGQNTYSPPPAFVPGDSLYRNAGLQAGTVNSAPPTSVFPPPRFTGTTPEIASPAPVMPMSAQLPLQTALDTSPPVSQSMSRQSSGQGPGIAVATPGYGLGIAEFGQNPNAIVFGQQEPVNVAEAQRRAERQQRYLDQERYRLIRAQQRAVFAPGLVGRPYGAQSEILVPLSSQGWNTPSLAAQPVAQDTQGHVIPSLVTAAPYPPINLMPSSSDNYRLQQMTDGTVVLPGPSQQTQAVLDEYRRSRRFSEPSRDGWAQDQ